MSDTKRIGYWIEEGEFLEGIRVELSEAVSEHRGQRRAARALLISQGMLSMVLSGGRKPDERMLRRLGWERCVMYRRVR